MMRSCAGVENRPWEATAYTERAPESARAVLMGMKGKGTPHRAHKHRGEEGARAGEVHMQTNEQTHAQKRGREWKTQEVVGKFGERNREAHANSKKRGKETEP